MSKRKIAINASLVFLNLSNTATVIPNLLFTNQRAINTTIILLINFVYLLVSIKKITKSTCNDFLFIIYVFVCFLCTTIGFVTNTIGIGVIPFFISNILFYLVLGVIYGDYIKCNTSESSMRMIFGGYKILFLLNVIGVILLFLLITSTNFDPRVNNVSDVYDLFKSNVGRSEYNQYYFPYKISILFDTFDIRIPFFQQYGIICGYSHEPHTLMFLITPAFIFSLKSMSQKPIKVGVILVMYLLVVCCTASTINILTLLACLFLYIGIKLRSNFVTSFLIIIFLACTVLMISPDSYLFITHKIFSRSAEYSESTIRFAFAPKTILGSSFTDLSYWDQSDSGRDVGFLLFTFNLLFLIFFIKRIVVLILNSSNDKKIIGFVSLYFFIHSMKLAMMTYTAPLFVFILFVLNKTYLESKKI